mgnify:CR=1 FL=1
MVVVGVILVTIGEVETDSFSVVFSHFLFLSGFAFTPSPLACTWLVWTVADIAGMHIIVDEIGGIIDIFSGKTSITSN